MVRESQFQVKNFGFSCEEDERELFLRTQYSKSRTVYLVYRFFIWTYQFGWFLAYYIHYSAWNPRHIRTGYRFLTRWGYIVNVTYFSLSLLYSIAGRINDWNHSREFCHIWLLRSTAWMLHSIGQAGAFIIVIVYWLFASRSQTAIDVGSALDVDSHGINLVLYVIEIFVTAFPMRLFHFIYPMLFGLLYWLATLFMHLSGDISAIYDLLDWANAPGRAVGYGIGLALVGGALGHLFMFGLFQLRVYLSTKYCSPTDPPGSSATVNHTFQGE